MKKIAIGIITASLALFVAGCSSSTPTAAPAPAPQAQAPAPAPYDPPVYSEKDAGEQAFLSLVQSEFGPVGDATALALGNSVCSALESGASLLAVGQVIVDNGFSSAQAGTLVGASIAGLCPEYEYLVNQLNG